MKHLILALSLALAAPAAVAHSPVVDDGTFALSKTDPYLIDEPEHSKAIFSELTGEPHYYKVTSDKPFRFYAGITQAKLDSCDMTRTFSFDVLDANMKRIDGRNGDKFEWWPWYEEFGKTWYWVGPEIGEDFKGNRDYPAGTYYVRVFNQKNDGKYVLAVGDEERFGVGSIVGMLVNGTMNKIRKGWWNEADCS